VSQVRHQDGVHRHEDRLRGSGGDDDLRPRGRGQPGRRDTGPGVPADHAVATFPAIIGGDVAGEVVEAGPGVTRLQPGDRVLGMADGLERSRNDAAEGAFQKYTVLMQNLVSPIPNELSFEQAAVLPLTLSAAATGLFQRDHLALPLPAIDAPDRHQTVLVWGGSTHVGSNGIQLARCAGYRVIATASPRNFGYVRSLGAAAAIDYHRRTAVDEIINSLDDSPLAGTLAIGSGSLQAALSIASQVPAGNLRRLPARRARLRGIPGRARRTRCWGRPRTDPQGPRPASHGSLREQARRPRVTRRPRPPDDPVQLRGY
jgi:hypothetical protein